MVQQITVWVDADFIVRNGATTLSMTALNLVASSITTLRIMGLSREY
jgi:hypothetical protein